MASLPSAAQKNAENVDPDQGGFALMPPGVYHGRLMEVDTSRSGAKGPYWVFQYDIVTDGFTNRKMWDNVSLSDAAAFKVRQVWDAFGVPLGTDTDEMCGSIVKLRIKHRTIQSGSREGELAEQIDRVEQADPEYAKMSAVKGASGKPATAASAEDLF